MSDDTCTLGISVVNESHLDRNTMLFMALMAPEACIGSLTMQDFFLTLT